MIRSILNYIRKPESRAIGLVFMAISLLFGAWVTRLPEIKENLGLSEAELGLALFFMPLGSITLVPFYGAIIKRLGEKRATLLGVFCFLLAILLPVVAPGYLWLMVSLYAVGLTTGLTDVAMNAAAAEVEKQFSRQIMSASHGFFSLGGMIGAGTASLFFLLEISAFQHLVIWSLIIAVCLIFHTRYLVSAEAHETGGSAFKLPPRAMLGLAVVGFCIMMAEGGITDWSTIYLKESLLASAEIAGLGFAGFSALMALGRFMGDDLVNKHGSGKLLITGCLLAMIGLAATLLGVPVLAIMGFSIAGLGYSVIVPILFSASARVKGVAAAEGIASVASSGYIGMLIGPVFIGFVAEKTSLSGGFVFLIILTVLALAVVLRRKWY